jgi:hypothetical protein
MYLNISARIPSTIHHSSRSSGLIYNKKAIQVKGNRKLFVVCHIVIRCLSGAEL